MARDREEVPEKSVRVARENREAASRQTAGSYLAVMRVTKLLMARYTRKSVSGSSLARSCCTRCVYR